MQKKLKGWQIALLIIFYPAGIIYLIVRCAKKKNPSEAPAAAPKPSSELTVFVTEKGKVYHIDPVCANGFADAIPEKQAIKRGLCRCKKCFAHYKK